MTDWQHIEKDGPPPNWTAIVSKDPDMGWLIYDGKKVGFTTAHPSWWNRKDERGPEHDGPTVVFWADAEPPDTSGQKAKETP